MIYQATLDTLKEGATEAMEASPVVPMRVHPKVLLELVMAVEFQARRAESMKREGQVLADLLAHAHGWGIVSCAICVALANWNRAKGTA